MSKEACRRHRAKHREELNAKARARYQLNKDKERIRRRIYNDANREKLRANGRAYDAMPERKARQAELERTEKRKATRRAYRKRNPRTDYYKNYEFAYQWRRRELHREKQERDPQYRIRRALRANLKNAIKGGRKGGSAIDLLGCSVANLKLHLERQWQAGMCWDNFGRLRSSGETWQIDHIQPLSSFDLTDSIQLARACHYTNLAPLWAIDNRRKANKTICRLEVQNVL